MFHVRWSSLIVTFVTWLKSFVTEDCCEHSVQFIIIRFLPALGASPTVLGVVFVFTAIGAGKKQ